MRLLAFRLGPVCLPKGTNPCPFAAPSYIAFSTSSSHFCAFLAAFFSLLLCLYSCFARVDQTFTASTKGGGCYVPLVVELQAGRLNFEGVLYEPSQPCLSLRAELSREPVDVVLSLLLSGVVRHLSPPEDSHIFVLFRWLPRFIQAFRECQLR